MNQNVNPFKAASKYLWDGTTNGERQECWSSICDALKAAIRNADCDYVKGKLALQEVRELMNGESATAWLRKNSPEFEADRLRLYACDCENARNVFNENVQKWRSRLMAELETQWDKVR